MQDVTRILAIRHGETAWNREGRIQGHLDIPLNAMGEAQARRVAIALADETVDAIFSSDLARARQTAEAIADTTGAPLRLDRALRERAFGIFEGQSFDEISQRWPVEAERWRKRDPDFEMQGGESISAFYARSVAAVERLARACLGQTLVIVAHGGVMDCLYRAGSRQDLRAARTWTLGNATINRLLYSSEGFTLTGWNDDSHLDGLSLDEI